MRLQHIAIELSQTVLVLGEDDEAAAGDGHDLPVLSPPPASRDRETERRPGSRAVRIRRRYAVRFRTVRIGAIRSGAVRIGAIRIGFGDGLACVTGCCNHQVYS
ncbi:hypothetical protein GCM10011505_36650 [Tistrella bauzanensis]|uniref:Uncharacterized protein n=1 Tax=Tistrella bauzanensis TaxID=657419 RepID=A0ABQ1IUD7_9PROT|nr:hypothetical protein GCM10011505_36650 [Tistrella bauzanensis]